MLPVVLSANGQAGGYSIANSLRFRRSASAYLNKTPASSGNRNTWTFNAWVKRGTSTDQVIWNTSSTGSSNTTLAQIYFGSDKLVFFQYTASTVYTNVISSQVFRDYSAWYMITVVYDDTQATASNRVKMYVNGAQITSFSTASYPSQNFNGYINLAQPHYFGKDAEASPVPYFDGYLAEVNFIDGQALTPSSFGEIDSTTGVWKAKRYTGTYGTNGFRLNFSNGTSTTTLGYDSSGNGNNWTTNNISLTAGSTYDWMIDSPTKFPGSSYGVGNYAVLNPLQVTAANIGTISNGNLSWSCGASATYGKIYGSISIPTTGKFYWEVTANGTANLDIGIIAASDQTTYYPGYSAKGYVYYQSTGQKVNNNTYSTYGASYTTNDVIGVAFDADAGTLSFYKNNVSQGVAFTGLTGTVYTATLGNEASSGSAAAAINFGQRPFAYTPPSGYKSLCTQNLPGVTIQNGAQYMAATLYTGTGSTQTLSNAVNGVSFQPDLVWIKNRSTALQDHTLVDSVRGISRRIRSDTTGAEVLESGFSVTAFNANGFTAVDDAAGSYNVNGAVGGTYSGAAQYVGWQWKAGGTAVTNTAGSITSSVSANPTAGFSVVTYTGNGTNPGATIGHGLGIAPSMIITKARNTAGTWWPTYHSALPISNTLYLNDTVASTTYVNRFSAVSSSTFTTGTNGSELNTNAVTYVAYCFAAIPGYSAFGSYTGNGSSDGPFVYCGFRPQFVLIKRTDSAGYDWPMRDAARSPYNEVKNTLLANSSNAEGTNNLQTDFLSNGFKLRDTGGNGNASGGTYIYAAFCEVPMNFALAR